MQFMFISHESTLDNVILHRSSWSCGEQTSCRRLQSAARHSGWLWQSGPPLVSSALEETDGWQAARLGFFLVSLRCWKNASGVILFSHSVGRVTLRTKSPVSMTMTPSNVSNYVGFVFFKCCWNKCSADSTLLSNCLTITSMNVIHIHSHTKTGKTEQTLKTTVIILNNHQLLQKAPNFMVWTVIYGNDHGGFERVQV